MYSWMMYSDVRECMNIRYILKLQHYVVKSLVLVEFNIVHLVFPETGGIAFGFQTWIEFDRSIDPWPFPCWFGGMPGRILHSWGLGTARDATQQWLDNLWRGPREWVSFPERFLWPHAMSQYEPCHGAPTVTWGSFYILNWIGNPGVSGFCYATWTRGG